MLNKAKRSSSLVKWAAIAGTLMAATTSSAAELATATFAAGCFWCLEKPFDKVEGVHSTVSGYIGGHEKDPSYKQVSAGRTGHTEALQIKYDPTLVSYEQLLSVFWRNVDPFDGRGQFCDKGTQYRPGIFYYGAEQKLAAEQSVVQLSEGALKDQLASGNEIAVEITEASHFYPAEDYHQNYYQRNPVRYKYYRYRCGRDARLQELWGKAPAEK